MKSSSVVRNHTLSGLFFQGGQTSGTEARRFALAGETVRREKKGARDPSRGGLQPRRGLAVFEVSGKNAFESDTVCI